MARLRYNGLSTTLGGSLASGATTAVTFGAALTYGGGTSVPTIVSPDYIPLSILDSAGKLAEVVYLTAYTSGATTGTIARGKEGTTGAARASGLKVVQAPTTLDGVIDSGAVLTKSAVQSIAASTETAITFDGEVEDTDNYHSNVTNTSRLTAPVDGVYLVMGTVEVASLASAKSVIVRIRKNGTNADGDGRSRMPGGAFPGSPLTRRVRMVAGDYVELTAEQNDTVARDVRASADGTSFTITRIA